MTHELAISDLTLQELRRETASDSEMQELKAIISKGWPEKGKVPCYLRPFYHHREELVPEQGIIFKENRCIVPKGMRREILKRLHSSHMGLESCLRRAEIQSTDQG